MRRRPHAFVFAATETGFAIAAFGCGLFDAPTWSIALIGVGMLAYWNWSRRMVLNRLRGTTWITVSTVGASAVIAIIAGAYWIGLASGAWI